MHEKVKTFIFEDFNFDPQPGRLALRYSIDEKLNFEEVWNFPIVTLNQFTNNEGKLTGASDLILNADVTFTKDFSKTANLLTTVTYNYFSDRIAAIGSAGKGDLIDKGIGSLDLILKSQISKKVKLGFSVKNILNPSVKRIQNIQNTEVLSFKNGINASFSFTYKLD